MLFARRIFIVLQIFDKNCLLGSAPVLNALLVFLTQADEFMRIQISGFFPQTSSFTCIYRQSAMQSHE